MLTEEDLEPAVDHETALTGVAGELAEEAVRQAEALLELEAEGGINTGDGDTPDEADERLLSEAERGYRAALVLGLEDAEAQQAALQRAYQGAEAALKAGKKPKWSKEQQAVAAALDAGDMGALQERLGLEGVEWIAGELRALAEREEVRASGAGWESWGLRWRGWRVGSSSKPSRGVGLRLCPAVQAGTRYCWKRQRWLTTPEAAATTALTS